MPAPIPPALLARFGLVFALPAALAVGVLALAGVGSAWAYGLAVAAVAAAAAVVAAFYADALRLTRWAEALVAGRDPPRPVLMTDLARSTADDVTRYRRILSRRIERLTEQTERSAGILDRLADPILLLDARRRLVRANPAAESLLEDLTVGRDLVDTMRHPEVLAAVDAVLAGGGPQEVEVTEPVPVARVFTVRVVPFDLGAPDRGPEGAAEPPEAEGAPAVLVSLHDITAMKRSEQMHADFVANASHELRTPLSSLVGFIETLRGPARDDEEARDRFLAIMEDQAARMARLINDLLSLSRIELEEHTQPTSPVRLEPLLRGVVDSLRFRAEGRNIALMLEAPPGLPAVTGDADQLVQVFQNLVDNALKYGRPGTPVVVRVTPPAAEGGMVAISVIDQGEGIAKEHIPRLTERFYRVDAARSRAVGGTGLGLAIVKHIVARHRGRLTIDSRPGQGSTFAVHLPVARAQGRRPTVAAAQ